MPQIAEEMQDKVTGVAKGMGKSALKIFAMAIGHATAAGLAKAGSTIGSKLEKTKISVKKLTANGESVKDLEITDANIKAFEPIARKYGIKYALKEISPSQDELKANPKALPKYIVFFKAKDESVLKAALTEFSQKQLAKKEKQKANDKRPKVNVNKKIAKNKEVIDSRPKNPLNKNKNKER